MSIEFYVRRRTSSTDDSRSGTLAFGPVRVTVTRPDAADAKRKKEKPIDFADGERVVIEIDELTEKAGTLVEPPSRELRRAAEVATSTAADDPRDEPAELPQTSEPTRKRSK